MNVIRLVDDNGVLLRSGPVDTARVCWSCWRRVSALGSDGRCGACVEPPRRQLAGALGPLEHPWLAGRPFMDGTCSDCGGLSCECKPATHEADTDARP